MSTAVDGIRHLARIVTIEETAECLKPSDRVHMARVGLWWVITSRTMTTGDKAVYFEVDSVLSCNHPAFNGLRGKTVETIMYRQLGNMFDILPLLKQGDSYGG